MNNLKKIFYITRGLYRLLIGYHIHSLEVSVFRFFLRRVLWYYSRQSHMTTPTMYNLILTEIETFQHLQGMGDYDVHEEKTRERFNYVTSLSRAQREMEKKIL